MKLKAVRGLLVVGLLFFLAWKFVPLLAVLISSAAVIQLIISLISYEKGTIGLAVSFTVFAAAGSIVSWLL